MKCAITFNCSSMEWGWASNLVHPPVSLILVVAAMGEVPLLCSLSER